MLERGRRVGLTTASFITEIEGFAPLQEADTARAELVAAIGARADQQGQDTSDAVLSKEQARELLARHTDTLSNRAVAYALSIGDLGLKRALTLSYNEVRYGDAAEDLLHVRALVTRVRELPEAVRTRFRLTPALIQAPASAADAYEQAHETQTTAKTGTRLATLALPELLKRLRAQLELMQRLIAGMRTEPDPRWEELYRAFTDANKTRAAAGAKGLAGSRAATPALLRTLHLHRQDAQPVRLARTNYPLDATVTVENQSGSAFLLWMAQADGAVTTPQTFPAGKVTTVPRAALGPDTARYLTGRFESGAGGEVKVVVRRGA
ncbi:hypothetical protein GCM10028821_21430 [Hymenobacter jeollabukensis]